MSPGDSPEDGVRPLHGRQVRVPGGLQRSPVVVARPWDDSAGWSPVAVARPWGDVARWSSVAVARPEHGPEVMVPGGAQWP